MTYPISFVYLSHFILGRINPIALKMCSPITVALSFTYLFITYLELGLHKSDVVFSLPPITINQLSTHPEFIESKWGLRREGNLLFTVLFVLFEFLLPCVQVIAFESNY